MWSGLFIALFAFATLWTYVYLVRKEAVFTTSALATGVWFFLAFTGGRIVIFEGSTEHLVEVGPTQYLFLGFALLSAFALVGNVLGYFPPEDEEISHPDYQLE